MFNNLVEQLSSLDSEIDTSVTGGIPEGGNVGSDSIKLADKEGIAKKNIIPKTQEKVSTMLDKYANITIKMKEVWMNNKEIFLRQTEYSKALKATVVLTLAQDVFLNDILFDGKGKNVGDMLSWKIDRLYMNVVKMLGLASNTPIREVLISLGLKNSEVLTIGLAAKKQFNTYSK